MRISAGWGNDPAMHRRVIILPQYTKALTGWGIYPDAPAGWGIDPDACTVQHYKRSKEVKFLLYFSKKYLY